MSDSVTIQNSDGETFAEVIDIIGVSEVRKAFQQSVKEGSLHKWFKGSKSKDGKPGWVNVVTGGTCASDKPGEGTPKCVSSSKRASMTKAERLSASRRKKKADPGQQGKSGAAKPTYVSTDKKKMKEELEQVDEVLGMVKKTIQLPGEIAKTPGKIAGSVLPEPLKSAVKVPGKIASIPTKVVSSVIPGGKKKMKENYIDEEGYDVARDQGRVRPSKDKKDATTMPPSKEMRKTQKVNKGASALELVRKRYGKSVMNTEEMKRDEYGDPIGGPKISKKQLKKNLTSNTPDEQHTTTTSEGYIDLPLLVEIPKNDASFRLGLMFRESLDIDKGMIFIFEEVGQHSFHMKNTRIPLDIAFVKENGTIESIKELTPYSSLPVYSDGQVLFAIEANRGWFTENNVEVGDEIVLAEGDKKGKGSGTKDACYHKVKSRYSVWPSAYASGALVKCRKVGAANWGNKSESVEMKNYLDKKAKMLTKKRDAQSDAAKNNPHFDSTQPSPSGRNKYEEVELDEKCWKGYKKKGMKTMFGKRYPNCVKAEDLSNWRTELELSERVGGAGTLVRQGVKVGGKKGGRAVQKGQDMAVKAGQGAKETAKMGNKSKMVGSGKFEKAGAVVGGVAGGLAGAVVDGPLPVGDIVGGIAGAKVGGKLGRQIDKIGAKKPMKEGITPNLEGKGLDTKVNIGKNELKKNYGKQFQFQLPGPLKNLQIDLPGSHSQTKIDGQNYAGTSTKVGLSPTGKETAKAIGRGAVKGGVIGATALTGAALAKRLMKKSDDKNESFSNWREDVGYEDKDDSKKLQEDDMKGMSVKSGHKRPTKSGAGMTQKGVEAYRRKNPGSKLKTAVTTKPSKLKKGSKAANRRKSYCARSAGQMKKFPKAAKDPDSRLRQARRRWNC